MNAYDFDKTIYAGDSTVDFYFFCLRKHPLIVLCLPAQLFGAIEYKIGKIEKTQFKEKFYCFLSKIKNIDDDVVEFWDKNEAKIKGWYKDNHKKNDLIISASPRFLLLEICKRIDVENLIASEVDKITGKYTGTNCYGEEKVRRFKQQFDEPIEKFYSDSKSDQPMADIAQSKFIVKGDQIRAWPSV